jgi:site-specific recombinase
VIESLRGFLRIGIFVGGTGLVLALFQPRDSAEFVLSVCSAALGLALVAGVFIVGRLLR